MLHCWSAAQVCRGVRAGVRAGCVLLCSYVFCRAPVLPCSCVLPCSYVLCVFCRAPVLCRAPVCSVCSAVLLYSAVRSDLSAGAVGGQIVRINPKIYEARQKKTRSTAE